MHRQRNKAQVEKHIEFLLIHRTQSECCHALQEFKKKNIVLLFTDAVGSKYALSQTLYSCNGTSTGKGNMSWYNSFAFTTTTVIGLLL